MGILNYGKIVVEQRESLPLNKGEIVVEKGGKSFLNEGKLVLKGEKLLLNNVVILSRMKGNRH
jgi:hypothetical protein